MQKAMIIALDAKTCEYQNLYVSAITATHALAPVVPGLFMYSIQTCIRQVLLERQKNTCWMYFQISNRGDD